MRALSPKVLRALHRFLTAHMSCQLEPTDFYRQNPRPLPGELGGYRTEYLLKQVNAALKPKRATVRVRPVRAAKKASRRQKVAELREQVVKRAGANCEACGYAFTPFNPPELDHMHGGANRRALECTEGVWLIHRNCHSDKTLHDPSRAFWLRTFLRHSQRHGYNAEPQRKARAELESPVPALSGRVEVAR